MACDPYFYRDTNTGLCTSCEETCDPLRPTKTECQMHCSAYLHYINHHMNTVTASNDEELRPLADVPPTILIIVVIFTVAIIVFAVLVSVVCVRNRNGHCQKTNSKTLKNEKYDLSNSDVEMHRKNTLSPDPSTPSLCQQHVLSYDGTPVEEQPFRCDFECSLEENGSQIFTASQETQKTDVSTDSMSTKLSDTRLKMFEDFSETEPVVFVEMNHDEAIDLQEDIDDVEDDDDEVEQGCLKGKKRSDDSSYSSQESLNRKITAVLQRYRWVQQFWWDEDGAKITVDAVHRRQGKEAIWDILRQEEIPYDQFHFELC